MKRILLILLLAPIWALGQPAPGPWVPVPAPKQSAPILIKGATVHVGDGRVLQRADIVIEGGKITAMSSEESLSPPTGGVVIDATGKHVYPGLIGVTNQLGLIEIGSVRQTNDTEETGEVNPNVRAIVSYNTDSHVPPVVRANGVLIVQVAPSGGLVSGQSAIVQLDAWNYEDAAVVAEDALHINWPVARPSFGGPPPDPTKDPLAEAIRGLNEVFDHATAYAAAQREGKAQIVDLKLAAMVPFVTGQRSVFIHADDANAIEQAVEFAVRRKLRLVIYGGADAHRVPHLLKQHNVPVVLQKSHSLPGRLDDDYDQAYKLARLLKDAGVRFCLGAEDGQWWQLQNLAFNAGTLAAFGLTPEEALRAVTLDAATILGVDKRLGSIEVGKDATLVISSGDLLDMRTSQVTEALIEGRRLDLSNKHTALYRRFQAKYGER